MSVEKVGCCVRRARCWWSRLSLPGRGEPIISCKRGEYADAGIPHYWIVDVDAPVSLIACHLAGEFGYQDGGEVAGVFQTTEPFAARIELDALT